MELAVGMRIEEVKESFLFRFLALTGVHPTAGADAEKWIPAFAGKQPDRSYATRLKSIPV